MLTQAQAWRTAVAQLATDMGCPESTFASGRLTITQNPLLPGRRMDQRNDGFLKSVSLAGGGVISCADAAMAGECAEAFAATRHDLLFDAPGLLTINGLISPKGYIISRLRLFYLPRLDAEPPGGSALPLRVLQPNELEPFRGDSRFTDALTFNPSAPDLLAVIALDSEGIAGMAGASGDAAEMWQIGINVLPQYRGKGLAATLVWRLRQEILKKGKLPFYGTAPSHIASQNVARKTGFVPAWAELYTSPMEL